MKKSLMSYFSAGFSLTNKSLDLFVFLALLSIVNLLPNLTEANILVFFALSIITFSIYFGFAMSLPVFLTEKQKSKTLTSNILITTTIKNIKRVILPLIVIFISFIILSVLLIILIILVILGSGGNITTGSDLLRYTQGLRFISIPLVSLFSVFTFSSIYFSLENNGVFSSLKQSVVFSFHHFRFILIVMVIELITEGVWEIVNIPFDLSVRGVVRTIVREYVTLFIIASSLIYYQAHKKSTS